MMTEFILSPLGEEAMHFVKREYPNCECICVSENTRNVLFEKNNKFGKIQPKYVIVSDSENNVVLGNHFTVDKIWEKAAQSLKIADHIIKKRADLSLKLVRIKNQIKLAEQNKDGWRKMMKQSNTKEEKDSALQAINGWKKVILQLNKQTIDINLALKRLGDFERQKRVLKIVKFRKNIVTNKIKNQL